MRGRAISISHYEGPADQFKKTLNQKLDEIIAYQSKSKSTLDKVSSFLGFAAKEKDPIINKAEVLKKKAEKLLPIDSSANNVTALLYDFLDDICVLGNELEDIAPHSTMASYLKVDMVNDLLDVLGKFGYNLNALSTQIRSVERKDTQGFFNEIIYKINRLSKEKISKTRERSSSSYARMQLLNLGEDSTTLMPIKSAVVIKDDASNKKIAEPAALPQATLSVSLKEEAKDTTSNMKLES